MSHRAQYRGARGAGRGGRGRGGYDSNKVFILSIKLFNTMLI